MRQPNKAATWPPKGYAAFACFVLLLLSGRMFGGPVGVLKLAYCEYPFSHITDIGFYPEPGARQFEIDRYREAVALGESRVQWLRWCTWLGITTYVAVVLACLFFISRRHPDKWLLGLVLLAAVGLFMLAFSEREVPFGF